MHLDPHDLRRGYLNALGVVCIWTSFVIFSRMSGKSDLTPYDVIALRYLVAAIAIFPLWLRYGCPTLLDWRKLGLTSVGALGFTLFAFNGFARAPANHAAILLQGFLPFSVAIMAFFLTHERPNRQRLVGLACIALGVGSMAHDTIHVNGASASGDLLLVAASLCWALYTVLLRRWKFPPMEATISVTLLAALLYLPVYGVFLPKNILHVPWHISLGYGLFQGILVAIIQMIFYTQAVHYLGASRLSMLAGCVPILASLGAVVVLDEPLSMAICLGLGFCCLGAWLGNRTSAEFRFFKGKPMPCTDHS